MRFIVGLMVTSFLLVGCGGGDPVGDDAEALRLEEWAVAVCDARAALGGQPAPTSLADLAAFERVADAFDEAITEFEAISPPESARGFQNQLLGFYRGISSAQRVFIAAATNADSATLSAATTEYQKQLQQVFSEVDPELPTQIEDALRDARCEI